MAPYKPRRTRNEVLAAERDAWQEGIARSRLVVVLWDQSSAAGNFERLAYAQQLGKPIRILQVDDTPLPDHLALGAADFQAARVHSLEDGARQLAHWCDALPEAPAPGGTP
jgi:hypothetical protein